MIKKLIEDVIRDLNDLDEGDEGNKDSEIRRPLKLDIEKIPTLEKGIFRDVTPQLRDRFSTLDSWIASTHGDWLGIGEMERLWDDNISDERLNGIRHNVEASRDNWPDDAYALFRPARLSLFAGSAYTYERIYLVWLDTAEEPELWVYDVNGEARYRDLRAYLEGFLADDTSATEKPWKLHQQD